MSKLPLVPFATLRKVAELQGFKLRRISGSHYIFRNASGQMLSIPNHGSRVIGKSLLRKIISQMGLTINEYSRLLKEI